MTVVSFVSEGLAKPALPAAARRISLQHTVVTFLLIELTLFFLSAIGAQIYLEVSGLSSFTQQQFEAQLGVAAVGLAVYLVAARLYPIYSPSHILDAKLNIKRLVLVLVATFSVLLTLAAMMKTTQHYSRLWFFTWSGFAIGLILFARLCSLIWIKGKLQRGACVYRALSVGIEAPPLTSEQLLQYTDSSTQTIKCTALTIERDIEGLAEVVRRENVDQIYISAPWGLIPEVASKLNKLRFLAVDIFLVCADERLQNEISDVMQLGDVLALHAGICPIAGWHGWIKRCADLAICLLALLVASPFMLVTAIAIKLESRGPILFRQIREGINGTHFELLKSRSMYIDQTDQHAARQTSKDDPRVTRVGRIIRRLSIDELPQLFNVLGGSMSLVGPRPHALQTSAEGNALERVVDYYASRHRVNSGITGWAQVNGLRGELDSVEKLKARVDHDLYYIANWSIWLDLKIIARTAKQLIFARSAY
jgi:Undecaprenyl-phosphate glucose phosphotransferase